MPKEVTLELSPKEASDKKYFIPLIAKKLQINEKDIRITRLLKKSIDARQRNIKVYLLIEVYFADEPVEEEKKIEYKDVSGGKEIAVIGAGPAGLFAALRLIELGCKPLIFERGKNVTERKKDIILLEKQHILNTDSNYCFGEGGAGTFSDGKLYTRSKKRGDHSKVLDVLYSHGADESILYDSHPHIGSDKLPGVIENIRKTILQCGGKIFFDSKITDLKISENKIKGIILSNGTLVEIDKVIVATGHSARDIFSLLKRKNIIIEAKPFAMGVRIEHPQEFIDEIQYHGQRPEYLPAASYNIVQQVNGRGVYSFCMCPGGQIVPSSTESNEVVVNGMSGSKRDSFFANSGFVVQITRADFSHFGEDGFEAVKLQEEIEKKAFENTNEGFCAPGQRISDFVNNRISQNLPESSYIPGLKSSPMHNWLPSFMAESMKSAFKEVDKRMKGFISNNGIMVGVESRTSSPVKIPRNEETGQHIQIEGLYPCGEGSGYSGGIVSSAVDGERTADKLVHSIFL